MAAAALMSVKIAKIIAYFRAVIHREWRHDEAEISALMS